MLRGIGRVLGVLVLMNGMSCGHSASAPSEFAAARPGNLLLAEDGTTELATQIGRSDWPAAYDGIKSPEFTIYYERYRDNQGSRCMERSYPQRTFESYRIGAQER